MDHCGRRRRRKGGKGRWRETRTRHVIRFFFVVFEEPKWERLGHFPSFALLVFIAFFGSELLFWYFVLLLFLFSFRKFGSLWLFLLETSTWNFGSFYCLRFHIFPEFAFSVSHHHSCCTFDSIGLDSLLCFPLLTWFYITKGLFILSSKSLIMACARLSWPLDNAGSSFKGGDDGLRLKLLIMIMMTIMRNFACSSCLAGDELRWMIESIQG